MNSNDIELIKRVALRNRLSPVAKISRCTTGICNKVYSIDDAFILKIEGGHDWSRGILRHQPGIVDKLLSAHARVPPIIDYGDFDGRPYLLMEKVRGANLVSGWTEFNIHQKENYIAQLAEELRKFHSVRFDDFAIRICSERPFATFKDALVRTIDFETIDKSKLQPEQASDVELLEEFYSDYVSLLDGPAEAVLVHNDLNLENIFYEGNQITGIIDFDWACQAPRDYELQKLVEVFHEPKYTVQETLEPLYENYKMTEEFRLLRKHYPEMFRASSLADRIRLYYLSRITEAIAECQNGLWNGRAMVKVGEEVDDLYKNGWLDELVGIS